MSQEMGHTCCAVTGNGTQAEEGAPIKDVRKMLAAYKNLTWSVINLVNAPRGRTYDQQRDRLLLKAEQRQQFVAVAEHIVANHLALGALGELSLRLSDSQLAITARNSQLGRLAEADIMTCPTRLDKPDEAAALHLHWHRQLYLETPARAVLLGHPPYAMTLANAGRLPVRQLMPEMWAQIGDVTLLSPEEVTTELAAAARRYQAMVIPQVGALLWGCSLDDVTNRAEALEYVSRLTTIAHQTGLTG
jgi:ribulose-5-phosphate 4-epimerase/fuculose-1-phosphate aldolase